MLFRSFHGPRQDRVTVDELLRALERDHEVRGRKGLPQLRSHMKHVRAFFALDRALAAGPDRQRDYIAARQRDGAATATINRELECLQRAFSIAVESGVLAFAPKTLSLPEHNARQGFFEVAKFEELLTHLEDPDLRDYLEWFFWTGMRPSGIRALSWAAFDRETWTLRLPTKDDKTGRGVLLALEDALRAIIQRRIASRRLDCPLIFHRDGRPIGDFRRVWLRVCQRAELAVIEERDGKKVVRALRTPYDLRRTALRNMVRGGTDPAIAMKISGHHTRATFDRYNIIDERDLRAAVLKTSAYVRSLRRRASNVVQLRAKRP